MINTFRITALSQYFIVRELVNYALVFLICYVLIIRFYDPGLKDGLASILCVFFAVVYVLPSTIIHVQYLIYNKHIELSFDNVSKTFTITNSEIEESFNSIDIKHVWIIRAPRWGTGEWRGLLGASDRYRYAYLQLQDGREFIITCLLIFDLEKFFAKLGITTIERRVVFPYIRMSLHKAIDRHVNKPDDWVV